MQEKTGRRSKKYSGIVLRKTKFKESSIIFELLSPFYGKVSFIAKGVRKSKSKFDGIFDLFNIVEVEGYTSSNSTLVLAISGDLIESKLPKNNYENFIAASVAVEFILNIEFEENEREPFYDLLVSLLEYLPRIKKNHILIIWRFFLRAFHLLGIGLNISKCSLCEKNNQKFKYFSLQSHGFVCDKCFTPSLAKSSVIISENLNEIITKLSSIGKYLDEIEVNDASKKQFNSILFDYFNNHFGTSLQLNSLRFL